MLKVRKRQGKLFLGNSTLFSSLVGSVLFVFSLVFSFAFLCFSRSVVAVFLCFRVRMVGRPVIRKY